MLLTGWRGYAGGAALAAARACGHAVTVLVRSAEEAAAAAAQGLPIARGDLAHPEILAAAVAGAEAVIHCAASDAPAFQPISYAAVEAMLVVLAPDARFVMHGGSLVFGPTGSAPAHPRHTAPPPFLAARAAIDQLVLDAAAGGRRAGGAGEAGPFAAALLLDQDHDGTVARERLGWSPRHETFAATLLEGIEPHNAANEGGPT
jgi:nucleoside-diphosphate-sugar epimerase